MQSDSRMGNFKDGVRVKCHMAALCWQTQMHAGYMGSDLVNVLTWLWLLTRVLTLTSVMLAHP